MTPQSIKLIAHDGSDVCPIEPLKEGDLLLTRFKGVFSTWTPDEKPHEDTLWELDQAYAVITIVEPEPVIEVGDVVKVKDRNGPTATVIALHKYEAWIDNENGIGCTTVALRDLTIVRKGERS